MFWFVRRRQVWRTRESDLCRSGIHAMIISYTYNHTFIYIYTYIHIKTYIYIYENIFFTSILAIHHRNIDNFLPSAIVVVPFGHCAQVPSGEGVILLLTRRIAPRCDGGHCSPSTIEVMSMPMSHVLAEAVLDLVLVLRLQDCCDIHSIKQVSDLAMLNTKHM